MCGRYQFTEPQNADLRRILQMSAAAAEIGRRISALAT